VTAATRNAARIDENQPEIVKALRVSGNAVEVIKMPSDLLVARNGITVIVEVKNPEKEPSKRRLTDQERDFYDRWPGMYCVIETFDDVLELSKALRTGFKATFAYCELNMQDHFATCYRKRGRQKGMC